MRKTEWFHSQKWGLILLITLFGIEIDGSGVTKQSGWGGFSSFLVFFFTSARKEGVAQSGQNR